MNGVQVALGSFVSMVVYGLLFAGVYKLFAISSQLNEIKDLLLKQSRDAAIDPYATHAARIRAAEHEWTVLDPKE